MKKTLLFLLLITLSAINLAISKDKKHLKKGSVKTAPVASLAYGIDISRYQGEEMKFLDAKKDDITFVICKATQGLAHIDPDFSFNWEELKKRGLIRGAYHFYTSADNPLKQAELFLKTVSSRLATDFPLIVDVEGGGVPSKQSKSLVQNRLITFLKIIQKQTGRKPMIYTNNTTAKEYLQNPVFANYQLWIANYNNVKQPPLPAAWNAKTWVLWQKSESYHEGSFINDFDVFNGSPAMLRAYIKSN
jgi:lysozyme